MKDKVLFVYPYMYVDVQGMPIVPNPLENMELSIPVLNISVSIRRLSSSFSFNAYNSHSIYNLFLYKKSFEKFPHLKNIRPTLYSVEVTLPAVSVDKLRVKVMDLLSGKPIVMWGTNSKGELFRKLRRVSSHSNSPTGEMYLQLLYKWWEISKDWDSSHRGIVEFFKSYYNTTYRIVKNVLDKG